MPLESSQPSDRVRRMFKADAHQRLTALLGQRYADYRTAWELAGPAAVPPFPVHLDLELFDNCNQRCVFCPRNGDTHPDLPYPLNSSARIRPLDLEPVFAAAADHDLYSINLGAFAEPLLNANVFEVIRRFHAAGVVDSRIITNGLLLDRHHDAIFDSGLVNLFVSIDAFREATYAAQRGPGFDRVRHNLLEFLARRRERAAALPIVRVSFVVTEHNAGEVDDFTEYWADHVDFVDIQARTDYRADAVTNERQRRFHCIDPIRRMAIIANGDILPCCTFWGRTLPVGNIHTDSLIDAWRGPAMAQVRADLLADRCAVCLSCQSP